jgi:hypothetical protein
MCCSFLLVSSDSARIPLGVLGIRSDSARNLLGLLEFLAVRAESERSPSGFLAV